MKDSPKEKAKRNLFNSKSLHWLLNTLC